MKLVAPTAKPIKLAPIRANLGVEAAYRNAMQKLIAQMNADLIDEIGMIWSDEPALYAIAQDASITKMLGDAMTRLAKRWQKNFDAIAPTVAKNFAKGATDHTDRALQGILKRAGFAVKMNFNDNVAEAYQAVLAENVGLIRSIPSQHFKDIEALVWQSVKSGHDVGTLTKALQERYGVTRGRAALIANDQNNKARATIEKVRRLELGIVEAEWMHTGSARHPRVSHVKASGKRFLIAKGMYLDGEWIQPGELIRCGCTSQAIISGNEE